MGWEEYRWAGIFFGSPQIFIFILFLFFCSTLQIFKIFIFELHTADFKEIFFRCAALCCSFKAAAHSHRHVAQAYP